MTTVHIHKNWAETLNAANGNASATLLEDFIDDGINLASPMLKISPVTNLVISLLLGKAVADGLARIGSEYTLNYNNGSASPSGSAPTFGNVAVCRDGWCSSGSFVKNYWGFPSILNGTCQEYGGCFQAKAVPLDGQLLYETINLVKPIGPDGQILKSFPQPPDIHENWTRLSFPIKRYGYGYAFDTVTIKLAAAVLFIHIFVAVVHICILVVGRRHSSFIGSLGEFVALALKSNSLHHSSAEVSHNSLWTRPTRVAVTYDAQIMSDHLELLVEDKDTGNIPLHYRRPIAERRYE